jgi:hypothetical protein
MSTQSVQNFIRHVCFKTGVHDQRSEVKIDSTAGQKREFDRGEILKNNFKSNS